MLVAWLAATQSPTVARADDAQRFDAGLRAGITVTDGEPANDIPGYGLFGHYRLDDRWTIGISVDQTEFDYEEPAKVLGIPVVSSGEPIDAVAEATVLGVWIERNFSASQSRTDWFLGAGIAAASVDVPDVTGPRGDSGSFDIHTEVDTEIIVSLMGGVRRELGENWFIEFVLRADQHFADWTSTDRISGATATIDDYTAFGGQLGLGFRF
jgi:hypothetical protein